MAKKMVINTPVVCDRCKRVILKAVTILEGVDEVAVDAKNDTVTVIGDVDAIKVVKNITKKGKPAEIESINGVHSKEEPILMPKLPDQAYKRPDYQTEFANYNFHCHDGNRREGGYCVIFQEEEEEEEASPQCIIM